MKRILYIVLVLVGVGALIGGIGIFLLQSVSAYNVKDLHYHPTALRTLLTDFDHISTIDAFFPPGSTTDAGTILNPYIPLDEGHSEPDQETWWNSLSDEQHALISDSEFSTLDIQAYPEDDLLNRLLNFDYWDPTSSGPYSELLSTPPTMPPAEMPIPFVKGLLAVAKVRLATGIQNEDVLPALKEVRHLARLYQGTEVFIFSAMGIHLLNMEREAYEVAVLQGILPAESWSPISSKDTDLAKSMCIFGHQLYLSYDDGGAIKQFYSSGNRRFNECSMLMLAGEQLLFRHRVAVEPSSGFDPFPMVDDFEKAWENSGCSLVALKQFWDDPIYTLQHLTPAEKEMVNDPYFHATILTSVIENCNCYPDASQTSPY